MNGATHRKEVPAELARAGEARHFIAWRGAVAGLGGGRLNELAVAAEAVLTDVLLCAEEGKLEIESAHDEEEVTIVISHPELRERRMSDLRRILERFLDGHELARDRVVLVKQIGPEGSARPES